MGITCEDSASKLGFLGMENLEMRNFCKGFWQVGREKVASVWAGDSTWKGALGEEKCVPPLLIDSYEMPTGMIYGQENDAGESK